MIIYTCMAASSAKDICFNRFDEEQYDPGEPFGSVTFYTHGPEPKWHAIALEQSIAAVTAFHDPRAASMNFASLSAEGAVTIYTETGAQTEQIAGAGMAAEGSPGYGRLRALRQVGRSLFACGSGGQVYVRRARDSWELLSRDLLTDKTLISNYLKEVPSFSDFADAKDLENWSANHPRPRDIDLNDVNGPDENTLYLVAEDGSIYFWDGNNLTLIRRVANHALTRIFVEDERNIWICGRNGILLRGSRHQGFTQISGGGSQAFLSMAKYQGALYVCSHANPSGLFVLDRSRGELMPVPGVPQLNGLHTITAVDGVMWLAGVTDIVRFDASVWDYIYVQGMREIW